MHTNGPAAEAPLPPFFGASSCFVILPSERKRPLDTSPVTHIHPNQLSSGPRLPPAYTSFLHLFFCVCISLSFFRFSFSILFFFSISQALRLCFFPPLYSPPQLSASLSNRQWQIKPAQHANETQSPSRIQIAHIDTDTDIYTYTDRQIDRQIDRQTDRQTDRPRSRFITLFYPPQYAFRVYAI